MTAMEAPANSVATTLKLHASPYKRSRVGTNPLKAFNLRSTYGMLVRDTAARLLGSIDNPTDPLTVADVVALAELRVRADQARRDPSSDPNAIVRLEGLIDRRMRRLGLTRKRALTRF